MTTEALKSTPITNLDGSPLTENTIGEGAEGFLRVTDSGSVASTAGVTTGSTYKMVRVPSNAKVKRVLLNAAAHGGSAAFDIDVAYSDSTSDGTQPGSAGNIVQISAADNKLFGAAIAVASAQVQKDVTFSGTFTTAMQNVPLWQALVTAGTTEFAADPGGFFDIVLKSTATDTSGGNLAIEVMFVV